MKKILQRIGIIIPLAVMLLSMLLSNLKSEKIEVKESDFYSKSLLVQTEDNSKLPKNTETLSKEDNLYCISYASIDETIEAYNAMKNDRKITKVIPNEIVSTAEESNKGCYKNISLIPEIKNVEVKEDDYVIALIDTGITEEIPNVIGEVSVIEEEEGERSSHGTRMAKTIVNENEDAKILSIRALDSNGHGTVASVYKAINYAIEKKVDIINLSFSGYSNIENSFITMAIERAIDNGILVVGSAGNKGQNVGSFIPGNIDDVIVVGSANSDGTRKLESNYGKKVDYLVEADSTSVASAKMTGKLSKNYTGQEDANGVLADLVFNHEIFNNEEKYDDDYKVEVIIPGFDSDATRYTLVKGQEVEVGYFTAEWTYQKARIWITAKLIEYQVDGNGTVTAKIEFRNYLSSTKKLDGATIPVQWASDLEYYVDNTKKATKTYPRPGEMVIGSSNTRQTYDGTNGNFKYSNPNYIWYSASKGNLVQGPVTISISSGQHSITSKCVNYFNSNAVSEDLDMLITVPYAVVLRIDMNGGRLASSHGDKIGTSGNYVTVSGSKVVQSIVNGGSLGSDGLANYNNSSYINIYKLGYSITDSTKIYRATINNETKYFDQTSDYSSSDFGGASSANRLVDLLLNWTANTYSISYTLNGGSVSGTNPSQYTIETNNTTIINPTKAGSSFAGWTKTVSNLSWGENFLNFETGQPDINTSYPKAYHTGYIGLKAGVTYTISGYGNYNASGIRWRIYDTSGNYLGATTGGSYSGATYTPTSDCYAKLLFINETTAAQRSGVVVTGSGPESTVVIPKGSTGNISLAAQWAPISATVTIRKNDLNWIGSGINVALYQGTTLKYAYNASNVTISGSTVSWSGVTAGTYKIYASSNKIGTTLGSMVDTGVTIVVSDSGTAHIDYYSLELEKGDHVATVTGDGIFLKNQTGTINTTVEAGYNWLNWSVLLGNTPASTTTAQTTVTLTQNTKLKSNAQPTQSTLSINPNGGSVSVTNITNGGQNNITTTTSLTKYYETCLYITPQKDPTSSDTILTVTYNGNNGTVGTTTNANTRATKTTTTYYDFTSWTKTPNPLNGSFTTDSGQSNGYTYIYPGNSLSDSIKANYSTRTTNSTTTVTLPNATRTGYVLEGWYTAATGGTKRGNVGDTYTPTASETLYAHWKGSNTTITIRRNDSNWSNSGINVALYQGTTLKYAYNASNVTVSGATVSWSDVTAGTYNIYASENLNDLTTLIDTGVQVVVSGAGTATIDYYILSLTKGTGISTVTGAGTYLKNKAITISSTASSGYDWVSWTKISGNNPASSTDNPTTVTLTTSTTIRSDSNSTPSGYSTLLVDPNGGEARVTPQGQSATTISTPTPFGNWMGASANAEKTGNKPEETNRVIYTIGYNQNSGTIEGELTAANTTSERIDTTTYTFNSWQKSAGATGIVSISGTGFSYMYVGDGNTDILTATWNPITTQGPQGVITLPNATRAGYHLTGWYTAKSGGTKRGDAGGTYTPSASETLYAHWATNTSTLIVNPNGGKTTILSNAVGDSSGTITTTTSFSGTRSKTLSIDEPTKDPSSNTTTYNISYNGNSGTVGATDETNTVSTRTETTTYSANPNEPWIQSTPFNGVLINRAGSLDKSYRFPDMNGVTDTITANYRSSTSVTTTTITLPTATRTGYTLSGWYTQATGGTRRGGAGDTYTPTASETLYAQWTINTATLNVNPDGGTVDVTSPTGGTTSTISATTPFTQEYNSTLTLGTPHKDPTNSNTIFTISYNGNTGTVGETNYLNTKSTRIDTTNYSVNTSTPWIKSSPFYGQQPTNNNKYLYTFPPDSGVTSTLTANYTTSTTNGIPSPVILPGATKVGYTFNGWYTSASGGTKVGEIGDSYTPSGNTTLYAQWTINSSSLIVTPDGGTVNVTSPTGGTATSISTSTTYTQNYNTTLTLGVPTKTESVNVTYGIEYDSCGGSEVSNTTSTRTDTINYSFSDWIEVDPFYGTVNNANTLYTFSQYSGVTSEIIASYTSTITQGTQPSVTLPNTTKTGYTFAGWYTEETGGTRVGGAGDSYTPTDDVILYAQWTPISYTIAYTLNSGSHGSSHPTSAAFDEVVNISNPTRTGYTFAGWTMTDGDTSTAMYGTSNTTVTTAWSNASTKVKATYFKNLRSTSGTVTLVANWTAINYTIAYELDGGTAGTNAPTSGKFGTNVQISNPTKTGYTFAGWTMTNGNTSTAKYGTSSSTVTTAWNPATTQVTATYFKNLRSASGTVTLTAHWTAITYTIAYELGGGTHGSSHPTSGTFNSNVQISNPTRTGYTFTGWTMANGDTSTAKYGTSSSTVTTAWSNGSTPVTAQYFINLRSTSGTVTLTATWSDSAVPTATIGSTSNLRVTTQTLTLTGTDNEGINGYYFGTTKPSTVTYTSVTSTTSFSRTESVTSAGTYYFRTKDTSGNESAWAQITIDSYTITNLLETIEGTTGTYTSSNYEQDSTGTFIAPRNTVLTIPAVYGTAPDHSSGYVGYSTTYGTSAATLTTSGSPTLTANNATYYMWFNRATVTLTLTKGTGINTVTGAGTYKYGKQVSIDATLLTGYSWSKWTKTSGNDPASLTTKATTVTLTQNTTLKANGLINTSKLTVNPNGGSVSVTSPTGETAETITASKTYTQNYNTTLTLGTPTKGDSTATTTYTLTYKYNDNSTADTTDTATKTVVTGYTFSSWTKSATFYGTLSADNATYTFPSNNNVTSTITAAYTNTEKSNTTTSVTLPNPTRTGYTLKGWYTAANGGSKIGNGGATYTPTQNRTLYAQWQINTSKLTVNPNGGSVAVTSPTGGTAETITSSKTYTQDYNTTLTLGTPTKASTTADTTFTISYNGNEGTVGTTNSSNTTSTRTDTTTYTFSSWTKSATFYGTLATNNQTYTFPSNNNVTSTITANYTSSTTNGTPTAITLPTATRTGYTLKGWYTAATNGTKRGNAQETYTPTASETLYAQWTANTYTISYTLNSGTHGSSHPTSGTFGQNVNISNPTRTGYTFAGWTMTNGNTSTAMYGTSSTTVTTAWNPATTKVTAEYFKNLRSTSGTVTLVANWTANQYQVLYEGNGGTQLVNSNSVGKYDGYFNNGNAHSTSATSWPDISGNNKNGTITNGTWGDDYLGFDGTTWVNLGQMTSSYQTIEVTFSVNSTVTVRENIIGNWETGGGGIYISAAGKLVGQFYIDGSWRTITANFVVVPEKKYHVALTYDGTTVCMYVNGVSIGSVSVTGTIKAPTNSTIMAMGGNPAKSSVSTPDFVGKIYNAAVYNTALTAEQIANDGGKLVTYNSTYGTLPTAARAGYQFNGWYTEPTGGTKVTSSSTIGTAADHVLYAHWTANTSTITIKKDNSNWTSNNNVQVALYQGGSSKYAYSAGTKSGATITWSAVTEGTYDIYASKDANNLTTLVDTGIDVVVSATGTATIDYYTLTLNKGVGISAVSGAGTYLKNQTANIDATVATGYTWQGWSVVSGNSPN